MPSVKAIAKSLGTFKPILLALMLVTAKARLPQKTASMALSCNNPIIISQVSTSSILNLI
jgi:hypothetical protein